MKYTSEFITGNIGKEEIKKIINDNFWYVAETPAVFQTGYPFQVGFGLLRNHWPKVYNTVLLFNGKGYFWFYANEADSLEVGRFLYQRFLENEKFIYSKKEEWKKDLGPFHKKASQVYHSDLSKLANQQLAKLYREFMASFYTAWTIPLILEMNTVYVEQVLAPRIKDELSLSGGEFNEIFATLSQPSAPSYLAEERIDLLNLALNFSDTGVKQHREKYYWIKTSYRRMGDYSVSEIQKLITTEIKKGRKHTERELKELKETPENVINKRKDLIKKYKVSTDDQKRFEMMRLLGDWQDKRKEMNIYGNHHIFLLLNEVGKRFNLDADLVAHAFPSEIEDVLSGKIKLNKTELQERFDLCFQATDKNLKEIFLTGDEARRLKAIIDKKIEKRFQGLKGMTASVGKEKIVKGEVRVVFNPVGVDIPSGSILVTPMTRPDFVHLMKKAAAIITDQGGVTSHAAIVSRELGVPCIVGTGISTKVLKDGDVVQVDIQSGVITKLN